MDSNQILIWYAEPDKFKEPSQLNRFLKWLSAEEHSQYLRFRFDKHRHTYLISHALVRGALSQITGIAPDQFAFKPNAYGKPFLVQPSDFASLQFNLSHTDGLAVVAISKQLSLGVDVENKHRQDMTQTLAEHFFAPEECQAIAKISGYEQTEKMLEFWTLKESYIKAVGAGLSIALDSFAFKLAQATEPAYLLRLDAPDSDRTAWRFWQDRPTENHLVALAFKPNSAEPVKVIAQQAHWLGRT